MSWSLAAHEYLANESAMDSAYSDRIVQSAVCRNRPNFVAEFSVHADWMEDFGYMPFYFFSNDLKFNLIYVSRYRSYPHNDLFCSFIPFSFRLCCAALCAVSLCRNVLSQFQFQINFWFIRDRTCWHFTIEIELKKRRKLKMVFVLINSMEKICFHDNGIAKVTRIARTKKIKIHKSWPKCGGGVSGACSGTVQLSTYLRNERWIQLWKQKR